MFVASERHMPDLHTACDITHLDCKRKVLLAVHTRTTTCRGRQGNRTTQMCKTYRSRRQYAPIDISASLNSNCQALMLFQIFIPSFSPIAGTAYPVPALFLWIDTLS